ncbi:polyphenol oxidase family protein [Phocicoccus pinnipedialis]|uniref:Laccase domain protein n=1 Tax=Phocicoccus pinnipedialis TaxID=110845 RepID=A0A6V7RGR3_9BACL|nr:polyphenol oxidase family protein [Jeotgalicoccus pinnipedialis]MBP1939042.1 YfiH family protein [Jeotgalicoccus pinnipedialis]CAD2077040.1 Laccase domain protein [Jeotgalicoccus pinnipedialis]
MLQDFNHYVGINNEELVLGYTKRVDGFSNYPKNSLNMALYVDDDITNVDKNQEILAREIDFETKNWVIPNQRHGNNVLEITSAYKGTNVKTLSEELMDIDAMYTHEKGILLGMNYADCAPVFIYSITDNFIGIAHAGWKGTKLEIIKILLKEYKGDIEDLRIIIGVTINKKSYEVDSNVVDGTWDIPESAIEVNGDKFFLDLKEINRKQALEYGLKESQIHVTHYGTEMEEFFSFRLEKGNTGRALGFIGRRST